jgi:N6-L-threonylcarbamoyladenine synthase
MRVLGIETSCDETGVAVYDTDAPGPDGLRAHAVYSQIALHAEYGGVVPELASRDHVRKLLPLIRQTLAEAGLTTRRPRWRGLYGRSGARGGAAGGGRASHGRWPGRWSCPPSASITWKATCWPRCWRIRTWRRPSWRCWSRAGIRNWSSVDAIGRYRLLGETLDDAAGEAFDKTAKLMGLPYPGGPQLAALAEQGAPASSSSRGR